MIKLNRDSKTKELKATTGLKTQSWRLYKSGQNKPFTISRSGFSDFLDCQRCFYLNKVKGLKDIDTIPFSLNNTVDELVKKEFDHCRERKIPHEVMKEYKLSAIPFMHKDLEKWRASRTAGIKYEHSELNLILRGGVDDLWVIKKSNPPELIIVDYKAQSKNKEVEKEDYLNDIYHQGYKLQLEFYRYLFVKNGFKVYPKGYFLVYNALKSRESLGKEMKFERVLIEYEYERSVEKIEEMVRDMKKVLDSKKIPKLNPYCQNCAYTNAGSKFIKSK